MTTFLKVSEQRDTFFSRSPNPPRLRTTCVNKCHLMPTCRWTFLLGRPSLRQRHLLWTFTLAWGRLVLKCLPQMDTLSHLASNLFPQDSPSPVVVVCVHLLCGRIVSDDDDNDDDDAITSGCGSGVENQFIGDKLWSLVERFIVFLWTM